MVVDGNEVAGVEDKEGFGVEAGKADVTGLFAPGWSLVCPADVNCACGMPASTATNTKPFNTMAQMYHTAPGSTHRPARRCPG